MPSPSLSSCTRDAADRVELAGRVGVLHVAAQLQHEHPAVAVEGDLRRLLDVRVGQHRLDLEAGRQPEALLLLFGRQGLHRRLLREVRLGHRRPAAAAGRGAGCLRAPPRARRSGWRRSLRRGRRRSLGGAKCRATDQEEERGARDGEVSAHGVLFHSTKRMPAVKPGGPSSDKIGASGRICVQAFWRTAHFILGFAAELDTNNRQKHPSIWTSDGWPAWAGAVRPVPEPGSRRICMQQPSSRSDDLASGCGHAGRSARVLLGCRRECVTWRFD